MIKHLAKDAKGNVSGHMGLADGTQATVKQVDLKLTKPAVEAK